MKVFVKCVNCNSDISLRGGIRWRSTNAWVDSLDDCIPMYGEIKCPTCKTLLRVKVFFSWDCETDEIEVCDVLKVE